MSTAVAPPPKRKKHKGSAGPTAAAPAAAPLPAHPTAADWLRGLGNVPLDRILFDPPPGTATEADVIRLSHHENRGVELVNGTLVEKPMGLEESVVSGNVLTELNNWAKPDRLGLVSGEQGMIRMLAGNIRVPDVALFLRSSLPGGTLPKEAAPRIAPALAVEVLSESNTDEEMRIKVAEYFNSGVKVVWMLDPPTLTLRVYDAPERFRQLTRDDTLDGGGVLPGFSVRVGELFDT